MNLSKHFILAELTESQTATSKGINNTPAPDVVANLQRLAMMLEQVRALVGGPVMISSGYRSPALNKAVGGAANSAHVQGLAADISAPGWAPKKLAKAIQAAGLAFDQLIYEGTWVHIGLAAGAPWHQMLTAMFLGGRATYSVGIA